MASSLPLVRGEESEVSSSQLCRPAPACPRTPLAPGRPCSSGKGGRAADVACPPHGEPGLFLIPSARRWVGEASVSGPGRLLLQAQTPTRQPTCS